MARQPEFLTEQQRALGRYLAALREAAGLCQADIARAVPCHRTTVTHAEGGSQLPASDFWEKADRLVDAKGALIARYDELIGARNSYLAEQQAKRRARAQATVERLTADSSLRSEHADGDGSGDGLPAVSGGDCAIQQRRTLEFEGAWEVPADPDDRERLALAARHPRRVDAATVSALADVLAATRRVEDQVGSAGVLPSIRAHRELTAGLLADAPGQIRDQLGSLTGELHQYLGWLLAETGCLERARVELDAALALGVEFDDPDLTSLALSFKGHLAWMVNDPQGVISLSCAARRDSRVSIAQHAFNAHQEARGWAMADELGEVNRALARADRLTERALSRQADTPPNLYWYGCGFFSLQRGLTWHTLADARFAERAAIELTTGLHQLPAAERDSEWAAIYTVAAAEALTTAREAERAIMHACQALAVCRATRSTRLARALRRAHTRMRRTWPTHPDIRELGDEILLLSGASKDNPRPRGV